MLMLSLHLRGKDQPHLFYLKEINLFHCDEYDHKANRLTHPDTEKSGLSGSIKYSHKVAIFSSIVVTAFGMDKSANYGNIGHVKISLLRNNTDYGCD